MSKPQYIQDTQLVNDMVIQPWKPILNKPQKVFLTGATGFFGGFLLQTLLQQSNIDKIYCLVRKNTLANSEKIIPILGDLTQPYLGLSEQDWLDLAGECDVIFHNGAKVNLMQAYEDMRDINVLGTKTIMQFATAVQTKPIHFISSIAAAFGSNNINNVIKEAPLLEPPLTGGYRQTKWVTEQLLQKARSRGLPVNIYRLSRIIGNSKTGEGVGPADLIYRLVVACIALQNYPSFDFSLNLVPADYASWAIVNLSQQLLEQQHLGREFHITNPQSITWLDFMELVKGLGYPLTAVEPTQWREILDQAYTENPKNRVYASLKFTNRLTEAKPDFDQQYTLACLQEQSCPAIDAVVLERYVEQWQIYYQSHNG